MSTLKTETQQQKKSTQTSTIISTLATLFRNGNTTTLNLIEEGISFNATEAPIHIYPAVMKEIKKGRRGNQPMEEVLLKTVIKELKESEKDTYDKFGFKFNRINAVWVQDTVEVTGAFSAPIGAIVMGNYKLENVTLSSNIFGNAYDLKHKLPKITLTGRIY